MYLLLNTHFKLILVQARSRASAAGCSVVTYRVRSSYGRCAMASIISISAVGLPEMSRRAFKGREAINRESDESGGVWSTSMTT